MHSLALITINHKVDLQTIKLDVCVSWLQKILVTLSLPSL